MFYLTYELIENDPFLDIFHLDSHTEPRVKEKIHTDGYPRIITGPIINVTFQLLKQMI
jgi:hypothetical protein